MSSMFNTYPATAAAAAMLDLWLMAHVGVHAVCSQPCPGAFDELDCMSFIKNPSFCKLLRVLCACRDFPEYVLEFQKCLDRTDPVPFSTIKGIIQQLLELGNVFAHIAHCR